MQPDALAGGLRTQIGLSGHRSRARRARIRGLQSSSRALTPALNELSDHDRLICGPAVRSSAAHGRRNLAAGPALISPEGPLETFMPKTCGHAREHFHFTAHSGRQSPVQVPTSPLLRNAVCHAAWARTRHRLSDVIPSNSATSICSSRIHLQQHERGAMRCTPRERCGPLIRTSPRINRSTELTIVAHCPIVMSWCCLHGEFIHP